MCCNELAKEMPGVKVPLEHVCLRAELCTFVHIF